MGPRRRSRMVVGTYHRLLLVVVVVVKLLPVPALPFEVKVSGRVRVSERVYVGEEIQRGNGREQKPRTVTNGNDRTQAHG